MSQELRNKKSYSIIAVFLVALSTFILGLSVGHKQSDAGDGVPVNYRLTGILQPQEQTEDLDFSLFWEVWDVLEQQYVEKDLDEKEMFYGAIKGMVDSLDDAATLFFSSEETESYNDATAGNFEGIGAELGYKNGLIVVKSPMKDYPAYNAGLRPGDIILKIDQESTEGFTVFDAVMKIRGEKNTVVTLNVISEGESEARDVSITRGVIHVSSVEWYMKDDVAVIELRRFTEDTLAAWMFEWDKTVTEVKNSGAERIILDLRGDSGGYFDAAIWAAGDFLPKDTVVSYQMDRNENYVSFDVTRFGGLLDVPMVVLIDGGSASASEILAGALKHYDRAVIIGKESYGKGTAQQILPLENGATLHITTQKWLLPDKSWISPDNKITPDIEIDFSREEFEAGLDPQLDKAIEEVKNI